MSTVEHIAVWESHIYSGGSVRAAGGVSPVVEASTGETLTRVQVGNPADINRAARFATIAQET
jgi:hypothetical protein